MGLRHFNPAPKPECMARFREDHNPFKCDICRVPLQKPQDHCDRVFGCGHNVTQEAGLPDCLTCIAERAALRTGFFDVPKMDPFNPTMTGKMEHAFYNPCPKGDECECWITKVNCSKCERGVPSQCLCAKGALKERPMYVSDFLILCDGGVRVIDALAYYRDHKEVVLYEVPKHVKDKRGHARRWIDKNAAKEVEVVR